MRASAIAVVLHFIIVYNRSPSQFFNQLGLFIGGLIVDFCKLGMSLC